MSPPLFNFRLLPIPEIIPWQQETGFAVHWFGLTDGCYWLRLADAKLFRYHQEFLDTKNTELSCRAYVNYNVVRLWEDVIDVLPHSLIPLPADLVQKIAASSMSEWRERVLRWVKGREDDESIKISAQANDWLYRRQLSTSHLKWSPKIWFWNDGINFHIEWDNRRYQENSISVWDAQVGHWSATVEEFIEEVRAFDSQFIQAMQQRVDQISANGMPKDVLIDIESLKAEQVDRAKWLERSLEAALHQPPDDWEAIRAAIEVIEAK